MMGSFNYGHKVKRKGRTVRGGDAEKGGLLVGGSFFLLSSLSLHHVTMCNWPVVPPELCKQISRETRQPEGLQR